MRSTPLYLLAAPILALPFLTACPPLGGSCTEEYRSSVTVHLYDEAGESIDQAELQYRIDGGTWEDCERMGGGYVCGWETAGLFEIEVSAMGFVEQSLTVTVEDEADDCHVISQSLTTVLEALDCTAVVVPAVVASVLDADGELAPDALVWWFNASNKTTSDFELCEAPAGSNDFSCAPEEFGEIHIQADRGGQYGSTTVEVDHDGCHPITESVTLQMDWLPD